ncbi:hypothetical protein [Shimia sp. R9_3]|uniref:hypothetical protein n=1 Tax=Shimia sp. R9_3 TaxID=2821113 RepID=UPI001ADCA875|nr:hypothetical protein [Shimia sp. R9_3]MBO9399743.1 hypothetical protein [Shimia sp. R9_3]
MKKASQHNPDDFPNVTSFKDRHGKRRWRYRKANVHVALGSDYGSEEFMAKLEEAMARSGTHATKPRYERSTKVSKRRANLSQSKVEKMLNAATNCGFYPTRITSHPDGSITMSFIEDDQPATPQKRIPKGWDI